MTNQEILFEKLKKRKQDDVKVLQRREYRGIWETAIQKYSDTAHFIYELIQNADDAKATFAEFVLEEEGLWFKHNGTVKFSISDIDSTDRDREEGKLGHINSITSIGDSSKGNEQKIGKFGIGFKAVFAYTSTPHIYSDDFNFKLENYIVPKRISPNTDRRKNGETLFYFPFNHETKSKESAYSEIIDKLDSLFQPILFLPNLEIIRWSTTNKKGTYTKKLLESESFQDIQAERVEVECIENEQARKEYLWVFSRTIANTSHNLSVGFFVLDQDKLEIGYKYEAFCFFPTKEKTNLGFLIQAPFLLTDNREGIKMGEQWNKDIMNMLAKLAADSILILKIIGDRDKTYLINENIFDLIPCEISNSELDTPFFKEMREIFRTKEILAGRNGKYYSSSKAYWVSDPELADLFNDKQISLLMQNPDSGLVFVNKCQKQLSSTNRELAKYIESLVLETINPEKLIRKITAEFIESQSDEWLIKFYSYLGEKSSYCEIAKSYPILLNQNRKAVIPYDKTNRINKIFLPTNRKSGFDTVYSSFATNEKLFPLFKLLELKEPNLQDDIYINILPQYNHDFDYSDEETLLIHFDTFLNYYKPHYGPWDFIRTLKDISFIAATNPDMPGNRVFRKPHEVYLKTDSLATYFRCSQDVFYVDEEFYEEIVDQDNHEIFLKFLKDLDIPSIPRLIETQERSYDYERYGINQYGVSPSYPSITFIDKNLEGLDGNIESINEKLSRIIWNYLLEYIKNGKEIKALVNYCPKYARCSATCYRDSTIINTLKTKKWLYDQSGNLSETSTLTPETMNSIYNIEDDSAKKLLSILKIENPIAKLDDLPDEIKEDWERGRKIREAGLSDEELDKICEANKQKARKPGTSRSDKEDFENGSVDDNPQPVGSTAEDADELDLNVDKYLDNFRRSKKQQSQLNKDDKGLLNEQPSDQDDYIKPPVNLEEKIRKIENQALANIDSLEEIKKFHENVANSEKYSFAWFKGLLELECLQSSEANLKSKSISIQFTKVEKESGTERTLILKHPSRYIPQSIEDLGDIPMRLYQGNKKIKEVIIDVASVKEYTLRVKVKQLSNISDIDLNKITDIVIDINDPVFVLEELRKSFISLNFEDTYNLRDNLTEHIKFIFGPPGTGKTTYLATDEIIPLMKKTEDLKVLVLTPTNKAADVLTKRIIEKMGDDVSYRDWLIRFGNTADPELENNPIVVDKTLDIRTKPKNTTITTIARFPYDYFQGSGDDKRRHLKLLHWDYIIIDEASMVPLVNIAYVLYQKPEALFIIAGDPFQIQPITQIEQWKDMNIYNMVELNSFANPKPVPHPYEVINLTTQYRSVPSIGEIFSHFTYDGILKHHREDEDQKILKIEGFDVKDINIIKFPVSKYESIYKPKQLNKSNYQVYSALFAVEFVKYLVENISKSSQDIFKIGVICPYRAQATFIEKTFSQINLNDKKTDVMVGTIHGFQGDECDIIVSIFNPPVSISKSPDMFLNKQNILNVSISRARDYLFILMPDDDTDNIENLYKIKKIENIINQHAEDRFTEYLTGELEGKMFGSDTFVYDNSFATSHQFVNVYSKPEKKYEIRCDDSALDVQINPN